MEVVGLLVGAGAHLFDEEEDDALDDKQHEEDDEDLGGLGLEKDDDVFVPIAFDGLKDAFVLRDEGFEEHDNGVSLSKEDS
jgi:hypothetical protein